MKPLPNNTTFFMPTDDCWILACLNSPVGWWYSWRGAQHGKDEALRCFNSFVESYPVPPPTEPHRLECDHAVRRLIVVAESQRSTMDDLLDWLKVRHEVAEPSMKLQNPVALDSDAFVAEVQKGRGRGKGL